METFDTLPVSAVVNGQYLALHGGISEKLQRLQDIDEIDRVMEPEDDTLLADLLWSDPARNKECNKFDYVFNNERNISCYFGKKPLTQLLERNDLKALVRAHQLQQQGFRFHTWNGADAFPPVITVFSAPNYCASDNDAAVMITQGDQVDVRTFSEL